MILDLSINTLKPNLLNCKYIHSPHSAEGGVDLNFGVSHHDLEDTVINQRL